MPTANYALITTTKANVDIAYVEPTFNTDGSPMLNLDKVVVEASYDNGITFGLLSTELATSPLGGGSKSKTIFGVIFPLGKTSAVVRFKALNQVNLVSANTDVSVIFPALPIPNPVT